MIRTVKYLLRPNTDQSNKLEFLLWQSRLVYNAALEHRIAVYHETGKGINYESQWTHFRDIRQNNFDTFGQINASSMQHLLRRLDKSFSAFFRRLKSGETPGYPRFKSRNQFHSIEYTYGDGCKLRKDKRGRKSFYIQNVGEIRMCYHRDIPDNAKIKHIVVKRINERWYVCFILELPDVKKRQIKTGNQIGIDVGLKSLMAFSNDELIENPRWLKNNLAKLRKLHRHATRQIKGSNRQRKTYRQISRLNEQIANQRADYLHKISNRLIAENDLIAIENLTLGFMNHNKHLSLSSHDAGFGLFRQMLKYKAESAGIQVIAVNPSNTSQACSECGTIVPKGLSVRIHKCHNCGLILDRDINAARNILHLALFNPLGRSGQTITRPIGEYVA
jgi:putative transposase